MGETHGLFQAQVLEAQKRLRRERSAAKWCNILVISQLESSSGFLQQFFEQLTSNSESETIDKLQLTLKINRKKQIEWGLKHRNKRHENFAKMVMHRDFSSDWPNPDQTPQMNADNDWELGSHPISIVPLKVGKHRNGDGSVPVASSSWAFHTSPRPADASPQHFGLRSLLYRWGAPSCVEQRRWDLKRPEPSKTSERLMNVV